MFTISCYSFHPLLRRFVVLWRYAQAVSDCVTFFLSCLCCQCGALLPLSEASSSDEKPSIEAFKIMSEPIIEAGRGCGDAFQEPISMTLEDGVPAMQREEAAPVHQHSPREPTPLQLMSICNLAEREAEPTFAATTSKDKR